MKKSLSKRKSETIITTQYPERQSSKTPLQKYNKSKQLGMAAKRQIIDKLHKKLEEHQTADHNHRIKTQTANLNTYMLPKKHRKLSAKRNVIAAVLSQYRPITHQQITKGHEGQKQERITSRSTINNKILSKSKSQGKLIGTYKEVTSKRRSSSPFHSHSNFNFISVQSQINQGRTNETQQCDPITKQNSREKSNIRQSKGSKNSSKLKKSSSKSHISVKEKPKKDTKIQIHRTDTREIVKLKTAKGQTTLNSIELKPLLIPASIHQHIERKGTINDLVQVYGVSSSGVTKERQKNCSNKTTKNVLQPSSSKKCLKDIQKIQMQTKLKKQEFSEISFEEFIVTQSLADKKSMYIQKSRTQAYQEDCNHQEQTIPRQSWNLQRLNCVDQAHIQLNTVLEKLPIKFNKLSGDNQKVIKIDKKWLKQQPQKESSQSNQKVYLPYPLQSVSEGIDADADADHQSEQVESSTLSQSCQLKHKFSQANPHLQAKQTSLVTVKDFNSNTKEKSNSAMVVSQRNPKLQLDRELFNTKEGQNDLLCLLKDLLKQDGLEATIREKIQKAILLKSEHQTGSSKSSLTSEQSSRKQLQPQELSQGIRFKKSLQINVQQHHSSQCLTQYRVQETPKSIQRDQNNSLTNKSSGNKQLYVQRKISLEIVSQRQFNSPKPMSPRLTSPKLLLQGHSIVQQYLHQPLQPGLSPHRQTYLVSPKSSKRTSPFHNKLCSILSPQNNTQNQKLFFFLKEQPDIKNFPEYGQKEKLNSGKQNNQYLQSKGFHQSLSQQSSFSSPPMKNIQSENNPNLGNVNDQALKLSEIKHISGKKSQLEVKLTNKGNLTAKNSQPLECGFQFIEDLTICVFKFIKDYQIESEQSQVPSLTYPQFYSLLHKIAHFKDFKTLLVLNRQQLTWNLQDQAIPQFFYCSKYFYPSLFDNKFIYSMLQKSKETRQLLISRGFSKALQETDNMQSNRHQTAYLLAVFHAMQEAAFIHYESNSAYYHRLEMQLKAALRAQQSLKLKYSSEPAIPVGLYKYFQKMAFSVISDVTSWGNVFQWGNYVPCEDDPNKLLFDEYHRRIQQQNTQKFVISQLRDKEQIQNYQKWILSQVSELIWIQEVEWVLKFTTNKWALHQVQL